MLFWTGFGVGVAVGLGIAFLLAAIYKIMDGFWRLRMADHSNIEWTDATCSTCGERLTESNRVESGRRLCKPCKNAAARSRYVRKGPAGRRGWLVPTRHGDKKQARRRVNYLVEQGMIPRAQDLPCMDCGDEVFCNEYRHEYDHALGYDGDNQLYVEPVCSRCHHNREDARRVA